jgi:Tol biopolymer transport system component
MLVGASTAALCALAMLVSGAAAIELHQITTVQNFGSASEGYHSVTTFHTPVWSQDGQSLVVGAYGISPPPPSQGYEIVGWLMAFDLDGTRLSSPYWLVPNGDVTRPSPDPMQQQFAFGCWSNLTCAPGVCVIDRDAAYYELNACLAGAGNPAWSPDGLTILAETYSGLRMFSPSGSAGGLLTNRTDDLTPAWSPDGKEIVFSSTQGGSRDLWIKDVTSGATRQLTADAPSDEWPAWSPDGGWIAFASERDGARKIWAIPSIGGNPILVADLAYSSAPAWSPDGQSLAFQSGDQVWVATGLPDLLVTVEAKSWSNIKTLYRGNN